MRLILLVIAFVCVGFGFGDEKGFPQSIKNTNALPHRRSDTVEGGAEEAEAGERADSLPEAPALSLLPPPPPLRRQSDQGPPRPRPQTAPQHFAARPPQGRRPSRPQPPGGGRPGRRPLRTPDGRPIFFRPVPTPPAFAPPAFAPPPTQVIVTHVPSPAPPTPSPSAAPTVGPTMGELLKVNADTPADTDHVPSFAAKTFVVREAPPEFHPPGYEAAVVFPSLAKRVEVPRTKFFCEEQSYLPGIYADVQLGCKVFHLCLPAAMGNTLTSFMCPNMTLFDQSIMQCNYWFNVNCASSPRHYDANLPMALSYRKINAAQLPLTAVRDLGSVALMGLDAAFNAGQNAAAPSVDVAENLAFRRRAGEVGPREGRDSPRAEQRDVFALADGTPRSPRTLGFEEDGGKETKKKKATKAAEGEKAGEEGSAADGEKPAKEGGKPEGDKQEGGKPEGGKQEGGKPEGGKQEGGKPEGGKPEGDKQEGGKPEGDKQEGGKPEGGKQQERQGRRRRSAAAPPLIMRLYKLQ
ncbi:proline-rich protein 12 isoform X2 [Penaeus vannamei]|uniref:proline-rich protein 12 isoform X2 n=1 Tax=Penaeus vannamei TaxID=6689 RepID=UPI00387F3E60